MSNFFHAFNGPRLFRIFRTGTTEGRNYEQKLLESSAEKVIGTIRFCWSLSYWTSPLLLGILYRRGHFTTEGIVNLGKFFFCIGTFYYMACFVRGVGRFMNPDYMAFLSVLVNAQKDYNAVNRRLLAGYDFAYQACPVLYKWADFQVGGQRLQASMDTGPPKTLFSLPMDIMSYICANTFGRRMVYPGATALVNTLVETQLIQGRAKLVEEMNGERVKVGTVDGNEIDTMFVDRRGHSGEAKGQFLVVCSEGNAAFYEIGAMETPLKLGYSVLGWNHPGFAGSTGIPFPNQEQHAIDAVMQYAIQKLGFTPDNIILYAWSIGGYTATWAAMNYPDVKYVILDATFDDIMPLANAKMPQFAQSLVELTVKRYLNLNIAEQLKKYPGPLLLIRRGRDEMITTLDPTAIHTNRGNFLLMKILHHRYPKIVDEVSLPTLQEWMSSSQYEQDQLYVAYGVDSEWCETVMTSYMMENPGAVFPIDLGGDFSEEQKKHMTVFLARKYMEDYDSSHCTPLPQQFFHKPWSPQI